MAKGIYIGGGTAVLATDDIMPKIWTANDDTNLSFTAEDGTILTASSFYYNANLTYIPNKAFDNSTSTRWQTAYAADDAWIKIKFTTKKKITKMNLYIALSENTKRGTMKIQGSNDDSTWTDLYSITGNQSALTEIVLNNTDYYQYYRIYTTLTGSCYVRCYEWQVSEYETGKSNTAHKVTKVYVGAVDDNLVVNGNFSSGLEGWNANASYGTATIENDATYGNYVSSVWSSTLNAAVVATENQLSDGTGGIFYMCCNARGYSSNTGTVRIYSHQSSINISNNDTWGFYSKRFSSGTITNLANTRVSVMQSGATATGNKLDITNIGLYNLTAIYGSGNEPTKEWCDANLATLKAGSVARKVKKGYIGVNNVARLFYSAE